MNIFIFMMIYFIGSSRGTTQVPADSFICGSFISLMNIFIAAIRRGYSDRVCEMAQ